MKGMRMTDLNKLAADIAEGRGLHAEIKGIIANIQDVPYLPIQTAALRAFNGKYDRALNNAEQLLQPGGGEDDAAKRQAIIALLGAANNYVLDSRWARLDLRGLEYELHTISPQALDEYYCPGGSEEEPWRRGTYSPATGMCTYRYNRERAVDYATFYASGTNPIFGRIRDADCANYASQTLHYSGLPMEGDDSTWTWNADRTTEWLCCRTLKQVYMLAQLVGR